MLPPESQLDPKNYVACRQCDALYHNKSVPDGSNAKCLRCGDILFAPRKGAIATIVSLSAAALIMMIVAISFPFLSLEASGLSSRASVIDAVRAFSGGSPLMVPLSLTVFALIILLPVTRLCALIYSLLPLLLNKPLYRDAEAMFRLAMRLRPWAMAEIFIVGVAVALVKIADLASVHFGPAFWAFVGLVILVAAKDTVICERSIWQMLNTRRNS